MNTFIYNLVGKFLPKKAIESGQPFFNGPNKMHIAAILVLQLEEFAPIYKAALNALSPHFNETLRNNGKGTPIELSETAKVKALDLNENKLGNNESLRQAS